MDSIFSSECLPTLLTGGLLGIVVGMATAFYYCFKTNNTPSTNIDANLISNSEAISMIERFIDCYVVKEENETGDDCADDTVSGHFELDVLLAYINKMKTQCDVAGRPMSGVEYYFAKYPNDASATGNRNSIVIYPTYQDNDGQGNSVHIPFDPFVTTLHNLEDSKVTTMRSVTVGARNGNRFTDQHILNRANMSPPREPLTF